MSLENTNLYTNNHFHLSITRGSKPLHIRLASGPENATQLLFSFASYGNKRL